MVCPSLKELNWLPSCPNWKTLGSKSNNYDLREGFCKHILKPKKGKKKKKLKLLFAKKFCKPKKVLLKRFV